MMSIIEYFPTKRPRNPTSAISLIFLSNRASRPHPLLSAQRNRSSGKFSSTAIIFAEAGRMRTGNTRMRLLPLIGATYFMVSGGPYGLEDIIGKAGYLRALIILAVVPIFWSFPTSLMVGELASAMPEEGGYY